MWTSQIRFNIPLLQLEGRLHVEGGGGQGAVRQTESEKESKTKQRETETKKERLGCSCTTELLHGNKVNMLDWMVIIAEYTGRGSVAVGLMWKYTVFVSGGVVEELVSLL